MEINEGDCPWRRGHWKNNTVENFQAIFTAKCPGFSFLLLYLIQTIYLERRFR